MLKKSLKLWMICISVSLFILCLCIGLSGLIHASAEETAYEQAQGYENKLQLDNADISALETTNSSKSSIYKNLGGTRLSEGNQGVTQIHYIENANYFLANPLHHKNDTDDNKEGTCTTVALQMLVGYHNYYSDRRLLPEFNANGVRLLEANYGSLNEHPIICYNPEPGLGRKSIGTSDNVYERIFEKTFWGSLPGLGQAIGSVTSATKKFLNDDSDLNNWTLINSSYNKQSVKAELDAGRPVIIGFDYFEGHSAHVIVAYGYANYAGNFCYITHYGWESGYVQMLVPESWLGYQVTMRVDHTHEFEDMGQSYTDSSGTVYRAMECETCGATTLVNYLSTLFAGGTGYLNDPFLISNAEQFNNIRYAYRSVYVPRQGMENQINYDFKLTNSITIPGDWTPFTYKFAGDFDGSGYYISYNMNLSQADINENLSQGLFGFVIEGGNIHDLELQNCSITSATNTVMSVSNSFVDVGILAGFFYSASGISNVTVTNPKIECRISNACIGVLAGSIYLTSVTNCVVQEQGGGDEVKSSITNNTHCYLGGMAGMGDIDRFSGGSIKVTLTNTEFNEDNNDMMGKVVGNAGDTVPSNMTADVTMVKSGCIAMGTMITLADGSQKAVEELTGEEMLLVWNLQTGTFDTAPILFIDSDPSATYQIINLSFSDGTTVKVIYEHGFWDITLNQYVYLDKEASQYIGHWFNKQTTTAEGILTSASVQLIGVTITQEVTTAYSPVTYSHLCYYVNGMLSMPGGIEGLFNIFEVDAETMKYDEVQMQADIAQYGLFTYEEFAELFPITEEAFEAFNGKYLKVAIGKGLIDEEDLQTLIERYAEFLSEID